jgi:hypothetical protein
MAEQLRLVHNLLTILEALKSSQQVLQFWGIGFFMLIPLQLLRGERNDISRRVQHSHCRDKTGQPGDESIAKEERMEPRDLADDGVVDQPAFDRLYDVGFLLHEAEAVVEGD